MNDDSDIRTIYYRILIIANKFISSAFMYNLDINLMKSLNPSADEIAKDIKSLGKIIEDLSGEDISDKNLASNAKQAGCYMLQVAEAIHDLSSDHFKHAIANLEKLFADSPY